MEVLNSENKYTFNFKRFKKLKKKVKHYLNERYGNNLPEIFKDKKFKEAFYKYVLWFDWKTDVFNSGRLKNIFEFSIDDDIKSVIEETKSYVMKVLYKE
jgi:adenine C2-methylase RlmN of 23S rRNA A2503 and tRNA A37